MDSNIKVSIITISYNSEKTIERTIKSVVSQDYPNIEYIIVDGGSSDNTIEIVKKYSNRISKLISENDDGISDAFNKGIKLASGEIIGIINSDDGLLPGAVSKLVSEYEENIDVYRGDILFWNEESGVKTREVPSMHFNYSGWGLRFCHQGTFVTKNAYLKYGIFNENYKYNMDFDLLLRFQQAGAKFKYINYDMAYFTMGGITFSKYSKVQRKEMEKIIKTNGGSFLDIIKFRVVKYSKMLVKKFINIDIILQIKNRGSNKKRIEDESITN